MRGAREFRDYLADIQEASQNILKFISGITCDEFSQDQKTIYAVVRAFEIIGEAAKKNPTLRAEATSEGSLEANGGNAR